MKKIYRISLFAALFALVFSTHAVASDSLYMARKVNVALKTNMLFDAVGGPNVAVELAFGRDKNFSATADIGLVSWHSKNTYALQTVLGGLGAKYWFNPKHGPLSGWNVGVYGMCGGIYDLQWGDGYQGDEFWSAGVSGGYSLPIYKCLNIEFALAMGFLYTPELRRFNVSDGILMWRETRRNVWRFSPTKVQVNLVWLIGKKQK
jgi:hypothetical protein